MKKIIVSYIILVLLLGCSEKQIGSDPVTLVSSQLIITKYIEKNNGAIKYIVQANSIVEKIKYNAILSTYTVEEFKNKILKNILDEKMTKIEKRKIISLTEIIFSLMIQQYETRWKYPVEPDYLNQIKVFFQYAAETAKLYEVKNAAKNDVG